jgi:hypothetical protein
MKQPGAGSEDAALWDKRCRELYNEDKKGNRNELLGEAKFGSWLRSLVGPIYFRKHGGQNRTLLEGSQNWIQEYRISLVIPVDVLTES